MALKYKSRYFDISKMLIVLLYQICFIYDYISDSTT